MKRSNLIVRSVLVTLLLSGTQACTTLDTDELALQRAYEQRVQITGTRIRQRVDDQGRPAVGYRIETFKGDEARELFRLMQLQQQR